MSFKLHSQLQADTIVIGESPLNLLLLTKDANYPWCILVPQRDAIREIHQLNDADQTQLIRESSCLSKIMMRVFKAEKMNVAALGNKVPQLHLHHIARHSNDPAWPKPIWDQVAPQPYTNEQLHARALSIIESDLNNCFHAH